MRTLTLLTSFLIVPILSAAPSSLIDEEALQISPIIITPCIDRETARFAYVQEGRSTQHLRLATFLAASPHPKAMTLANLATFDNPYVDKNLTESVMNLSSSPNNEYLLVYSLEYGIDFLDYNFTFYDMLTGEYLGLKNEHSFASINNENANSPVFDQFLEIFPPEVAENYDFTVMTEGGFEASPEWQWNEDGTVTLQMSLEVHYLNLNDQSTGYIGMDNFYQTLEFTQNGINSLGFGPPPLEAANPWVFQLSINEENNSFMKAFGDSIRFKSDIWGDFGSIFLPNYTKKAIIIEGNIPALYKIVE